jgi:hypothetical protein
MSFPSSTVALAALCAVGAALFGAGESVAGPINAAFEIRVTLSNPGDPGEVLSAAVQTSVRPAGASSMCTSEAREGLTSTWVQVVCTVGPFVTITPMRGQVSTDHSGEAYRTRIGAGTPLAGVLAASAGLDPRQTMGTLTALYVPKATGNSSALEMLVSF